MSATPAPPVQNPADLVKNLQAALDIKVSGVLPGETALAAILNYAAAVRGTMDPALLKRWDAIAVQQAEDCQTIWRSLFVAAGLLK